MKAVMPQVWMPGDTRDAVMALHGRLLGYSRQRLVWLFGFQPGTLIARAFDVSAAHALWVLSVRTGTVIETYEGPWEVKPPSRFVSILEAAL